MNHDRPPLILISNDDGYKAKGLGCLIDFISDMGPIVVCAPEDARSGFSMAFSVTTPLRLKKQGERPGLALWSCNGTPVDCVKLALSELLPRRPDIIIGGINHGDNASVNSHYSGTMGIVTEGCMKHVPSVAFSLCDYSAAADFSPLRPYIRAMVTRVLAEGLTEGVCLNVNFPPTAPYKGVRICRMAYGTWGNEVVTLRHPRGYDYHWLTGEYTNDEPAADDTDNYALTHGYVAVTPTTIDVTAHEFIDRIKSWEESVPPAGDDVAKTKTGGSINPTDR